VNIPASIDSAKAAVGFFSTFTANVHPYNYAPCRNYQSTVTPMVKNVNHQYCALT